MLADHLRCLSLRERENHPPGTDESRRAIISDDERQGTLSLRERAGVRGNKAHAIPTVSGCLSLLEIARERGYSGKLDHCWESYAAELM